MLAFKIINSTAADWFGIPSRLIPDADMWRFTAAQSAARKYLDSGSTNTNNKKTRAEILELFRGQNGR